MTNPVGLQDLLLRARRAVSEAARAEHGVELKRRLKENPRLLIDAADRRPRAVVWELTLRCNLRCAHCGSAAGEARGQELGAEEALGVCDQLAALGCEIVTLLGGEPFLRDDWPAIAGRLKADGVRVNAISNGWLLGDERLVERIAAAGLSNIALSLDGLSATHDAIRRRPGSFARLERAISLLQAAGMSVAAVTVVHAGSLPELGQICDFLVERGVVLWQLQLAVPGGRLKSADPYLLPPAELPRLADFVVARKREGRIRIDVADNIGYFGPWEEQGMRVTPASDVDFWHGCMAGVRVLGLEANGDVKGCLSLPSLPRFIEGNVRERPLGEIWRDPEAFAYNRRFALDDLSGFCRTCEHASLCRAGCTSAAFGFTGGVAETPYCLHCLGCERR